MNIENVVICKDKSGDICSMGIPIQSNLISKDVFFLNKKKDENKTTNLFRKNLGIPLPLYLITEKADEMLNVIVDNSLDKKEQEREEIVESFLSDDLFEQLLRLASKKEKKLKTKKNRLPKKKQTKKKRN